MPTESIQGTTEFVTPKPRSVFVSCFNHSRNAFEVHKVELKPEETVAAYMDDLQGKENESPDRRTVWVAIEAGTEEERLVKALAAGRSWQARADGLWDDENK